MARFVCLVFVFLHVAGGLAPAGGDVRFVQGHLWINGEEASEGDRVNEGDRLKAGDGTRADVVLDNGARFRLYSRSELLVPENTKTSPFRLIVGKLLSIVRPGRPYTVEGRTAVAGTRGATFFMAAQKRRRTYVCVCEGKVHLEGLHGRKSHDVEAEDHRAFSLDDETLSREPLLYHTDYEIEELKSR